MTDGRGPLMISEVDLSRLRGDEALYPEIPPGAAADPLVSGFVDRGDRVDIAVFYTAKARDREGGRAGIEALIDLWVAGTNAAYRRSGIAHRLELVYTGLLSHTFEEDETHTGCTRWNDWDGCAATAAKYRADLIHTLVNWDELDVCGRASYPDSVGPVAAVTSTSCGLRTFAHELGHNHGLHHDRYEVFASCTPEALAAGTCFYSGSDSLFPPYAYGYTNQYGLSPNPHYKAWNTIMAYYTQCSDTDTRCSSPLRFSNPLQTHRGDRLGVVGSTENAPFRDATDAARRGPASAARTHNDTAYTIANYAVREETDLAVKGVRFTDSDVQIGGIAELSAVVHNLGRPTLINESISAIAIQQSPGGKWFTVDGSAGRSVVGLDADESRVFRFPFEVKAGMHARPFRVRVSRAVGETLIENNISAAVYLDPPTELVLDFEIHDNGLAIPKAETIRGSVTVANYGSAAASASTVDVWEISPRGWGIVISKEQFTFSRLAPSAELVFDYSVQPDPAYHGRRFTACFYETGSPAPPWNVNYDSGDALCSHYWPAVVNTLWVTLDAAWQVVAGSPFTVSVSVANVSSRWASAGTVNLYGYSPSGSWVYFGVLSIPAIAPGGSTSVVFGLSGDSPNVAGVPLAVGRWWFVSRACQGSGSDLCEDYEGRYITVVDE